ncbi:MAG: transcriptional regulator [Bacteroidia bacterium]|nr:transcriptional regulator [Bacteroidia bacterium]
MNYIRHLNTFFEKASQDDRLNPTHISLYMALFQYWNINRFRNPVSISRHQLMKVSKIGSRVTYNRCLRQLHMFNYINYIPSHNPFKGSLVNMINFCTSTEQALINNMIKSGPSIEQLVGPSINNIKNTNNKTIDKEHEEAKSLGNEHRKFEEKAGRNIPPGFSEVETFFIAEKQPQVEAQKFFNHFRSNGWKVGGKTPMENWQAAALNWMLNSGNFKSTNPKTGNLNVTTTKDYSEPL